MFDQAAKLREWMRSAEPIDRASAAGAPWVVVTSGRAGVGATTIAVNLAGVLADEGQRVLLLDIGGGGKDLARAAGIEAGRICGTLTDVSAGRSKLRDAIITGPLGVRLVAISQCRRSRRGSEFWNSPPTTLDEYGSRRAQECLFAELQEAGSEFDVVVVDLGSRPSPWTRRFWLQAQLALAVTTTENAARLDTYAMIKRSVAGGLAPDIRVVVNQFDDDGVASETARRLSVSCERFLQRAVPPAPSVPRHVADGPDPTWPRVWEAPTTPFGHAMLWLGRAVGEVLSESRCRGELGASMAA